MEQEELKWRFWIMGVKISQRVVSQVRNMVPTENQFHFSRVVASALKYCKKGGVSSQARNWHPFLAVHVPNVHVSNVAASQVSCEVPPSITTLGPHCHSHGKDGC